MDKVIRKSRRMAGRPLGAKSDEELLNQFFTGADEEAFSALVRRHGAMVLGVCLRLLHNRQDAEDAFQATFLTLVRKGHLIRHRGALSSWLYRVAFRVALRLKAKADKSRTEVLTEVAVNADPGDEIAWRELRPVLDTEVNRLPAKYRAPIVLCYLEGKTYEEAAGQLGCPKGTIAIRLLRGKVLLKPIGPGAVCLSAGLVAGLDLAAGPGDRSPVLQAVTASAGAAPPPVQRSVPWCPLPSRDWSEQSLMKSGSRKCSPPRSCLSAWRSPVWESAPSRPLSRLPGQPKSRSPQRLRPQLQSRPQTRSRNPCRRRHCKPNPRQNPRSRPRRSPKRSRKGRISSWSWTVRRAERRFPRRTPTT